MSLTALMREVSTDQSHLECHAFPMYYFCSSRPAGLRDQIHGCCAYGLETRFISLTHVEGKVFKAEGCSTQDVKKVLKMQHLASKMLLSLLLQSSIQVRELRERTDALPDDYFVVLVGDMITEEALPTYMAMLNTLDGVRDETGASPTPWGR